MTLAELGSVLRKAREGQQRTLADVADHLKIPSRILMGIEEGSERIPRTVYVYHFIKDYALLLGFSASEVAEWLDSLEEFQSVIHPVMAESSPYTSVKPSILPTLLSGLFKGVFLIAVVCGVYMVYLHFFAGRDYGDTIPVPPASNQSVSPQQEWDVSNPSLADKQEQQLSEQTPLPGSNTAENLLPEITQGSERLGEQAPVKDQAPLQEEKSREVVSPTVESFAASPTTETSESEILAVLPEGMHQVEVIADAGDCWMGFEPDGKKQQRTLRKGDTFSMTFRDTLILRLGHALAVRIIYDGKEMERSSSPRVVTMTFPPQQ
jgi:cytoskeleton protein RodZ